jgi:hypothetical protein
MPVTTFWTAVVRKVNTLSVERFEVFMAVKIQVKIFWVVMLCSFMEGYRNVRSPCWYSTATLHAITTQKTST